MGPEGLRRAFHQYDRLGDMRVLESCSGEGPEARRADVGCVVFGCTFSSFSPLERTKSKLPDVCLAEALQVTCFEVLMGRTPFEKSDQEQFSSTAELEVYYERTLAGAWIGEWLMSAGESLALFFL